MFLKKLLFYYVIFTISVTTAYAADFNNQSNRNIFLGVQILDYSHDLPQGTAEKYTKPRPFPFDFSVPIGSRIYLGYRFNKNFSLEFGYTSFKDDSSSGDDIFGPDHLKINSYDLTGKLIYPLNKYFDIYTAFGGTIIHEDNYNLQFISDTKPLIDYNVSKLTPHIGAGISVNFIRWLSLDLSARHIFSTGRISSFTYGALGLSLHFHV